MKGKYCELCKGIARMHCESDQANLCWSCDSKVHSANFLVARHSRTLLCHVCQSPTRWTAAGSNLCPTVSVCRNCFLNYRRMKKEHEYEESVADKEEFDDDYDVNEDDEDDAEDDMEDVDNGDNQVVPWRASTPPPNSEEDEESLTSSSSAHHRRRLKAADLRHNV